MNYKYCPQCRSKSIVPDGAVFIESGEWDGKGYELEGYFERYECSKCKARFVEMSRKEEGHEGQSSTGDGA